MQKQEEYPVLIGSQALTRHGFKPDDNNFHQSHDWDVIMTPEQNHDLRKRHERWSYSGWYSSFNANECRVDACKVEDKRLIYDFCNSSVSSKTEKLELFDHPDLGKILVAPLQLLYALKKAHIHRILQHHSSTLENVKTWREQVFQYLWMREKLGYKKMDAIIYHPNESDSQFVAGDIKTSPKKSSESELDYTTRQVFLQEFKAVSARVGDTKISMQKTEEEFFTDGVNRFIDHDELHVKVAQMCRQTDELLFKRFMTGDSVEMDQELFLSADRTNQIQTIREEIIVLLLERKLIPTMVRNRDFGICYNGLDMERRTDEMLEIIAHFMTNLCGQGHHWLRRWCIDHYKFFNAGSDTLQNLYPHKDIDQIAVEISRIQDLSEKLASMDTVSLADFVLKGPCLRTVKQERWGDTEIRSTDLNSISEYRRKEFTYSQFTLMGKGDNCVKLKCVTIWNAEDIRDCTLKYSFDQNPLMTLIMRRMTSPKTKYVYCVGTIIYDAFNNIGIIHKDHKPDSLFRVSNIVDGNELAIHIETLNIEDLMIAVTEKAYVKHSFNYYYDSAPELSASGEDLCPGQSGGQINIERSYISTYGTMPRVLTQLFEPLARHRLNCLRDQKKLKRGATAEGQYIESDDRDAWASSSEGSSYE
jgi:hypothetical protein